MSQRASKIQLPKSWPASVRSAMLHVVSLARFAAVSTRSWAADSPNARVRSQVHRDRAQEEEVLLREEMRIKDARMTCIAPHRRPFYPPTERMAILELRATRGWSLQQTADAFLLTAATIASWMSRLDEQGPEVFIELRQPVNKFPEFVQYAPANRKPRIEPRPNWPRGSPCARPQALVAGQLGARFNLQVEHLGGHSQLPIIRLHRAA